MDQSLGNDLRDSLSRRHSVLEEILTNGKTKPELVDALHYSRSTVDRAIDELNETGCVRKRGRSYRATPVGRTALRSHREFVETTDGILAAEPVLNGLAPSDPIDHVMFPGAEVNVSDPQTPEVGLERSVEIVRTSRHFRGYASVAFEEYFDILTSELRRDEFRADLIVERGLMDRIQTHFAENLRELLARDGIEIRVTDRMVTYAPWLAVHDARTYAGMTVYEDGAILGTIVNDSEAAVAWMRELLSTLSESATRYT